MRGWRAGTLTLGLVLIGFGSLLITGHIQRISVIDLIYIWWPAVFIMLGIEVDINSNMNLNINKDFSKASVNQVLGDGKVVFNVSTSNGNIEINSK